MSRKGTIEEMHKEAAKHGGKCLSSTYVNSQSKLKWQCSKGHIWKAVPNHVRQGTWCPKCRGKERGTIEEMRAIAAQRGGLCLSTEYVNQITKLTWQCANGHTWQSSPGNIKLNGSWCPECAGQKPLTIEDLRKNAEMKGGKCLSKDYINNTTKLNWLCNEGHTWWATPRDIRAGRWCPTCAGTKKKSIDEMQELAKKRGGVCLSTEYVNIHTKLKWRCCEGHEWEASPAGMIGRGRWCPICSTTLSENMCRAWFEAIFNVKFKKVRPKWLDGLELDGYNPEMRLAFEYQGEQHYIPIHGPEKLKLLQLRDLRKRQRCLLNKITLIEVPCTVTHEDMGKFIVNECVERGIVIKKDIVKINHLDFDVFSKRRLAEMQQLARDRGGECLSDVYYSVDKHLQWKCSEGHIWLATPYTIKSLGTWCPNCAGKNKTIEDMQEAARKQGGLCLSKEYWGVDRKLKWQCSKGHTWEALPNNVLRGSWCPDCGHNVSSIEEMRELAKEQGGECPSDKYLGANRKLQWRCKNNHLFTTTPNRVRRGAWCRQCSDDAKRLSIQTMQSWAEKFEGKCLSEEYINNSTKLTWECKYGHTWEATPASIREGHWCKACGRPQKPHKRYKINDMMEIAESHGGKCLSREYMGSHVKLLWECSERHVWEARPYTIVQGGWCPTCCHESKRGRMKWQGNDTQ